MEVPATDPLKKARLLRLGLWAYLGMGVFWAFISWKGFSKAQSTYALLKDSEAVAKVGVGVIQQVAGLSLFGGLLFGFGAAWCLWRIFRKMNV